MLPLTTTLRKLRVGRRDVIANLKFMAFFDMVLRLDRTINGGTKHICDE
jgi:hypothetical protein